jgi:hypothetical protein
MTSDLFEIKRKFKNLIVEIKNLGTELKSQKNVRAKVCFLPFY